MHCALTTFGDEELTVNRLFYHIERKNKTNIEKHKTVEIVKGLYNKEWKEFHPTKNKDTQLGRLVTKERKKNGEVPAIILVNPTKLLNIKL
jgi:hypothetical protein